MVNPDVFLRKTTDEIVMEYENILKTHGLLEKYSMSFKNHILVEGSVADSPIINQINNIKVEDIHMSPKEQKSFIKSVIIKCPVGKERNPTTKRCIKTCKTGFTRNASFKCRKQKTKKSHKIPSQSSVKKCAPGKELNPHTKRCNKTCKVGYKRDGEFRCRKDK
jgi:hypothetical protein